MSAFSAIAELLARWRRYHSKITAGEHLIQLMIAELCQMVGGLA